MIGRLQSVFGKNFISLILLSCVRYDQTLVLILHCVFHIMSPRRAYTRNANNKNENASPQVPNKEVSNVEFWNAIKFFAQCVTNQKNQRVLVPRNAIVLTKKANASSAFRVWDFVWMNQPQFLGLQIGEDLQDIIDNVKKVFRVMLIIWNHRVELTSYQLKDVAYIWYTDLKENRGMTQFW